MAHHPCTFPRWNQHTGRRPLFGRDGGTRQREIDEAAGQLDGIGHGQLGGRLRPEDEGGLAAAVSHFQLTCALTCTHLYSLALDRSEHAEQASVRPSTMVEAAAAARGRR